MGAPLVDGGRPSLFACAQESTSLVEVGAAVVIALVGVSPVVALAAAMLH